MKKRILLIEDDLFFQQMLKDLLTLEGFEIFIANNGLIGIQLFKKIEADLVITDIIMPEKEGTETIIELRQMKPDVKIIAMSGGGRGGFIDYLETANEFGVDATFSKPFNNREFLEKLHALLKE